MPFPPNNDHRRADRDRGWLAFVRRLMARLNPVRRPRASPRVIKRKMPKWHVKRAQHTTWPRPQPQPTYTILRR